MAFTRTIDWEEYWEDADGADRAGASPSAELVVDPLLTFLEERGDPDALADVGCGTGTVPFAVAERYPDADVVGYDAAEAVVADDREEAADRGLSNVAFERATLPAFDHDRQFDVICCFYTLCYVPAVEDALRALYDAVAPGGALVITYHNRLAQSHFQGIAADPHEHLGESSPWDPDRFDDRFAAMLDGESLLSHERIHDVLGTWPQSVWSVVGDDDRYPAWRHNPLVYVPK
jgi:SAM-dependent methyltransferase